MKAPQLSRDKSLIDTHIEQYCRSVAELLERVEKKSGKTSHNTTLQDDPRFMDDTEELFEY